eukprot:COSAG02_NODE_1689_length_11307_cov_50.624911_11_plen_173_part_00
MTWRQKRHVYSLRAHTNDLLVIASLHLIFGVHSQTNETHIDVLGGLTQIGRPSTCLRGTDGNTDQTTGLATAPPPLTTARTGWHWSSSSTPGREEESWRSCECCDLRQQNDLEAPGNGQPGGPGELAGPGGEVVGLMGCKEGSRPLSPYPRASLTASRPRRHCPSAAEFLRA